MKTFSNVNPKDLKEAAGVLRQKGPTATIVGGGSDLLGMVKEHLVTPDVLVNLKSIRGLDHVTEQGGEVVHRRADHARRAEPRSAHPQELHRARRSRGHVGTPQIRNAGTLAGNVCQRPWCWYFRNGFPCYKNGGKTCFSVTGENEFHAIFGGGPSFIVHPSDTARRWSRWTRNSGSQARRASGPSPRPISSSCRPMNPARENVLAHDEVLAEIHLPAAKSGARSTYHKEMDRESWTHAVVSVAVAMEMDGQICKSARVVLGGVAPIPWRVPKVEAMLAGKRITPELAAQAGAAAVEGARPLAKNQYKVPLTQAVVKQTLVALAG